MEIKNSKELKKYNRYIILNQIIERQPISRTELAEILNVSHTTISQLVKELIEEDLVVESYTKSTGGRPPKILSFKGYNKYIITLSFKETAISLAIFNLNFKLLHAEKINVKDNELTGLIEVIGDVLERLILEKKIKKKQILAMGISVPGIYKDNQDLIISSTAPYLNGQSLMKKIKNKVDFCPVFIQNDANIAVHYEWNYMLKKRYDNLIFIYIGDGIGSGIIIGNKLYSGSHGNAGELGHMQVKSTGKRCICGGTGCLEMLSSIKAIENEFKEKVYFTIDEIIKGYLSGEEKCKRVIDRAVKYFARALSSMVSFFDPEIIILGDFHNLYRGKIKDKLEEEMKKSHIFCVEDRPELILRNDRGDYQFSALYIYVFEHWKKEI
ncbi:ROK family transcriptional regulator [Halocella sp. SP3-1]|uniref:ROK family transcriptional regulator n=1 Tax=Halocella sp. SP3-1 TaxID=2382161 RepID=UPI000F758CA7|nr:ROK family transcriptional regulator [Halocella sp. SP3-1]AZO93457.1 ROK family transcriptional regulator [Halocella sp. SP3-1]